jgi:hypothetical protein
MKLQQLQLQVDNPPLAAALEKHFRVFEYRTCWPHHAPTETKYNYKNGLKFEMVPYVINHYLVIDTLQLLHTLLQAIYPEECTVDPHLPPPLQCQQIKYLDCKHGAGCTHNNLYQECTHRHADAQAAAKLEKAYPGPRSRFFDTYDRMALHCCKFGLDCYNVCGFRHHPDCFISSSSTGSSGPGSPNGSSNGSSNGSCSGSDCTDEYSRINCDGVERERPSSSSSSSSGSSASTSVEAFDSDWTLVGTKTAAETTTTAVTSATASVFNKGAKGRKGFKSGTVLPSITNNGAVTSTTASVTAAQAPPSYSDKAKSKTAFRMVVLSSKKTNK